MVQEIISGVAETPRIFLDERKADKDYISIVKKNYKWEIDEGLCMPPTTIDEAIRIVQENDAPNTDILYFILNLPKE